MEYDLFLDESGQFTHPKEPTLIGGFLLKRSLSFNEHHASGWRKDIQSLIVKEGFQTSETLNRGRRFHELLDEEKRAAPEKLNGILAEKEEIKKAGFYVFNHCSENRHSAHNRWNTECRVLKEFLKRITDLDGQIVIFDNPGGEYFLDSNTTYLTVFSLGFMNLYRELASRDNAPPMIFIHAAERLNVTLRFEKKKLDLSPIPDVGEEVLVKPQYVSQMKNCAFLHGGIDLLKIPSFSSSLDKMEILQDTLTKGVREPNPLTVVCDYICNCFYNRSSDSVCETIQPFNQSILLRNVFSEGLQTHSFSLERIQERQTWDAGLMELISRGFPGKITEQFFDAFQRCPYPVQRSAALSVVQSVFPYIDSHAEMASWCVRLETALKKTSCMNPQAYLEFSAHLLLYLYALNTHQGRNDRCAYTETRFRENVLKIEDLEIRNALILLFLNRGIVSSCDTFQYETGEEYFRLIRQYWEMYEELSADLICGFAGTGSPACAKMIEYGRSMGSAIQLYIHRMHQEGADLPALTEEAFSMADRMMDCFSSAEDLSRGHQNRADLYSETGHFAEALQELCLAIDRPDLIGADIEDQSKALLAWTGPMGEGAANRFNGLFIFSHFVLAISRNISVEYAENPNCGGFRALRTIVAHPFFDLNSLRRLYLDGAYPKPVILWHLVSSLARTGMISADRLPLLTNLLDLAYDSLKNGEITFSAIGIAILADKIDLTRQGLLLPDRIEPKKDMNQLLSDYARFKTGNHADPFVPLFDDPAHLPLKQIVSRIAY